MQRCRPRATRPKEGRASHPGQPRATKGEVWREVCVAHGVVHACGMSGIEWGLVGSDG